MQSHDLKEVVVDHFDWQLSEQVTALESPTAEFWMLFPLCPAIINRQPNSYGANYTARVAISIKHNPQNTHAHEHMHGLSVVICNMSCSMWWSSDQCEVIIEMSCTLHTDTHLWKERTTHRETSCCLQIRGSFCRADEQIQTPDHIYSAWRPMTCI